MKLSKEFNEDQKTTAILEIKAALKANKDLRMHERYQIILMALNNEDYEKIAKNTRRTIVTVYNYLKAYRQGGIAGLQMEYSTGRPRLLTEEQEQKVYQTIIEKTPSDVSFPAKMNWTSPIVRKWIEREFGVFYSDRGTRDLLYRLNLSFTSPTYTLAKADPIKQEAFKEEFEVIKKNS